MLYQRMTTDKYNCAKAISSFGTQIAKLNSSQPHFISLSKGHCLHHWADPDKFGCVLAIIWLWTLRRLSQKCHHFQSYWPTLQALRLLATRWISTKVWLQRLLKIPKLSCLSNPRTQTAWFTSPTLTHWTHIPDILTACLDRQIQSLLHYFSNLRILHFSALLLRATLSHLSQRC